MIDLILFMMIGAELDILNGWYFTLVIIRTIIKYWFWIMIFLKGSKVGEE